MNRSITAILIFLATGYASSGVAQSVDPVEGLRACAELTDRTARLRCFDDLGERVLGPEVVDQEAAKRPQAQSESVAAAATVPTPPADAPAPVADIDEPPETFFYTGLVTSCKKGYYGDWFFIFEDGQIWKESNKRNRRFSNCNFKVAITKDVFGYDMRIEGREETIRVARNK